MEETVFFSAGNVRRNAFPALKDVPGPLFDSGAESNAWAALLDLDALLGDKQVQEAQNRFRDVASDHADSFDGERLDLCCEIVQCFAALDTMLKLANASSSYAARLDDSLRKWIEHNFQIRADMRKAKAALARALNLAVSPIG